MRRGMIYILGLFLFFSLIGFASAGCSGKPNQTIMKLSYAPDTSNLHGALWNQSGVNICYNDLFEPDYNETGNPHDGCTDTNNGLLLKLYDVNNSHAAYPTFAPSSYNVSVCYRGLKCGLKHCDPDDDKCRTVVYVSNKTNAHISSWSFIPAIDRGYLPISCTCTESGCTKKEIVVGPTGCDGYTDNESCTEDASKVAIGTGCGGGASCQCIWNATAPVKCAVRWTVPGRDASGNPCGEYNCTVSGSEATECSGGSKVMRTLATVSKTLTCLPPEGFVCQSGSATVPCGGFEEASLPFFGAWQLIISLVSIALVYVLIERKRLL